jgi:hypothetical protein
LKDWVDSGIVTAIHARGTSGNLVGLAYFVRDVKVGELLDADPEYPYPSEALIATIHLSIRALDLQATNTVPHNETDHSYRSKFVKGYK